ncbi:MAG: hypothetical protein EXR66_05035 [Dehalococcoidia bacterium]|nr:hypothetical protein [Dehalococcoidia bacterium]
MTAIPLPRAALSTMWAVQPRFEADIASFLTVAAEAGFAGIEVNHSMDPRQARTLIEAARATGLEARSLHAPAPWSLVDGGSTASHLHGRENRTLNLASLDEAERRLAVEHHARSIQVAAQASMTAVVVHLGGVGHLDVTLPAEDWLRAAYLASVALAEKPARPELVESSLRAGFPSDVGAQDVAPSPSSVRGEPVEPPRGQPTARPTTSDAPRTTEYLEHLDAARRERAAVAAPWLDAARRSLADLAARAAEAGLTLGLESRLRYHEFPLPEEAADLLREHPADVAGYWHDVGHVEVLARLGLVPLEAWRELLAARLVGVHIHDVRGLTDHRAPGTVADGAGVDFAALAAMLPSTALRTFEVDQHEPPAALASSLLTARTAGVVG